MFTLPQRLMMSEWTGHDLENVQTVAQALRKAKMIITVTIADISLMNLITHS